VGPRVGQTVEQMKSLPLLGREVSSPCVQLITLSLYRLSYPGSRNVNGASVISATGSLVTLFKTLALQSGTVQIFANDSNKYKLRSRSTEINAD
jgi:hypothetical protein